MHRAPPNAFPSLSLLSLSLFSLLSLFFLLCFVSLSLFFLSLFSLLSLSRLSSRLYAHAVTGHVATWQVLSWGAIAGGALGALQIAGLPLLGVFTPLPEVRRAAVVPSIIGAALQLINGIVFVGEGVMVASGAFSALAAGQVAATLSFLLALRLAPPSLVSVWMCFWLFNGVRLANFARFFWFSKSPLLPDGPPPRK